LKKLSALGPQIVFHAVRNGKSVFGAGVLGCVGSNRRAKEAVGAEYGPNDRQRRALGRKCSLGRDRRWLGSRQGHQQLHLLLQPLQRDPRREVEEPVQRLHPVGSKRWSDSTETRERASIEYLNARVAVVDKAQFDEAP
jgi:hypothetical protein